MPTQEERIQSLERTQVNLVRSVSDLNHHVTIIEGILTRQEIDIRDIKNSTRTVIDRLGVFEQSVSNRLETIASRFEMINNRFDAQDARFELLEQSVNERFETVDRRFDSLEKNVNERFEAQDRKLDQVLLLLSQLTEKPE